MLLKYECCLQINYSYNNRLYSQHLFMMKKTHKEILKLFPALYFLSNYHLKCMFSKDKYDSNSKQIIQSSKNSNKIAKVNSIKTISNKMSSQSMLTNTNINKDKKSSKWIFSTKHQEMLNTKIGKIRTYCHIPNDVHDLSLRVIQTIKDTQLIITSQPSKLIKLLIAYRDQHRFASNVSDSDMEGIRDLEHSKKADLLKINIQHQYNTQIEISKYIELQSQSQKKNLDAGLIYDQAQELKKYMSYKQIQESIKQISHQQGFPLVVTLKIQQFSKYLKLTENGINIMLMMGENEIQATGSCLRILEDQERSYQIFPSSDNLLKAIVASGLPADRFSLDYNPVDIQQLLNRRKNMKMCIGIKIETLRLQFLMRQIKQIFGNKQILYMNIPNITNGVMRKQYKGQLWDIKQKMEEQENTKDVVKNQGVSKMDSYIVIAPYLSDFNQDLKQQMNKKSHIIGELQSSKINEVQIQLLLQKLKKMEKKEQIYEINLYLMTAELLARIQDQAAVINVLKKIAPTFSQNQIKKVVTDAMNNRVTDYLGLDVKEKQQKQQ